MKYKEEKRKASTMREATRYGVRPETITLKIREPGSALTHLCGFLLLAIGAGPLIMKAAEYGSTYTVVGMLVFILSSCVLYAASTAYHTVVLSHNKTAIFRKLDHMSISIMIAGTYTPVCLTYLRSTVGPALLIAVWSLALAGACMKLFWITCPKWLSSVIYVAMGWVCVFAIKPLLEAIPFSMFLWLLAGGIFYTVGAVIYALHPKNFDAKHIYFGSHEIFHVFIMLGTLCHYIVMIHYVVYIG